MSMSEGGGVEKDKTFKMHWKTKSLGTKESFPLLISDKLSLHNKIRNQGTSKCPIFNQDFGCQDFMHLTFWKECNVTQA